jgi:hypothetical protein
MVVRQNGAVVEQKVAQVRHLLQIRRNFGNVAPEVDVVELDIDDTLDPAATGVQHAAPDITAAMTIPVVALAILATVALAGGSVLATPAVIVAVRRAITAAVSGIAGWTAAGLGCRSAQGRGRETSHENRSASDHLGSLSFAWFGRAVASTHECSSAVG